jgi:hypothetical protein
MRIGEINKDNYKMYLQLIGAKNTKPLDDLFDEDKVEKRLSFEELAADAYARGHCLEGMMVKDGDTGSWHKIVPVPDWIRQAVIDYEREIWVTNANGTASTEQGDNSAAIKLNYLKTIPPSERLSARFTLQQIAGEEAHRLILYLKEKVPGWNPGQSFDRRILTDTNYGLDDNHLDVKA